MTNQVFVYGSLTEGMVHFSKIEAAILRSQKATAHGAAYRLQVGYPILLEEGSTPIPGFLIEFKSFEFMLSLLDEFHGFSSWQLEKSLHYRKLSKVHLGNGLTEDGWIYYLNPQKLPSTAQKIESHDWEKALTSPKFTESLTERQVSYIRKLGSLSGRDVVPVDLTLYRELINLELIVDKGRRLALSKFGQEVYRYLGDS